MHAALAAHQRGRAALELAERHPAGVEAPEVRRPHPLRRRGRGRGVSRAHCRLRATPFNKLFRAFALRRTGLGNGIKIKLQYT